VALEIRPEQGVVLTIEGFQFLELTQARNLLCEHTMQPGINPVRFNRDGDERAHRLLHRPAQNFRQLTPDRLPDLLLMALDDGGDECLLAGKILVERADAHPRHFRDAVSAGLVEAFLDQNASSRFHQCIDRSARSLLGGDFPGFCKRFAGHFSMPSMRVLKANDCSYSAQRGNARQYVRNYTSKQISEEAAPCTTHYRTCSDTKPGRTTSC
jgi:hypothetical protein